MKWQLQMYDADVKVMPRRADGGAMSWVGGWGSRKDVGLGKRQAEKPNGTFPVFACVRACECACFPFICLISFPP